MLGRKVCLQQIKRMERGELEITRGNSFPKKCCESKLLQNGSKVPKLAHKDRFNTYNTLDFLSIFDEQNLTYIRSIKINLIFEICQKV